MDTMIRDEQSIWDDRVASVGIAMEDTWEWQSTRLSSLQLFVKRSFDIVLSLIALVVLAPIFILVAVAIKLDSTGPIVYTSTRVGKHLREFRFYKFRSMRSDADQIRVHLHDLNEASGPIFKMKSDPRITRIGAFLRRYSIDELPQFLNVLRGDMSLVGPRPPLPNEVAGYNQHQLGRLAVKPGITCLWQIQGRSNIPFHRWVELDLDYINKQSFWLDIKIILQTIPAVIKANGAW